MKLQPYKAIKTFFGYDAIVEKKRRRAPLSVTKREDKHLTTTERKKLIATTRDQRRNISLLAWMIRKHLDYVSKFSFQPQNDNKELNEKLKQLFTWWAQPKNCDVAQRHSLSRFVRLCEAHRVVDGDVGIIKLRSGQIQAIEGDRIAKPDTGLPDRLTKDGVNIEHGVVIDDVGRAKEFIINRRNNGFSPTSLSFERVIPARNFIHHGFFDRFDQVRGVSPLTAAINTLQDLYEAFDSALIKAKMHAMFGIAISRAVAGDDDGFGPYDDKDTGSEATGATSKYQYDIEPGLKLELDEGDAVDTIESKTPSTEFSEYAQLMIQIAILTLDLPFSFFDSRKSSYSSQRQDLLQYVESAKSKRQEIQTHILNNITAWKINQWTRTIPAGDTEPMLILPAGMLHRDVKWEWRPVGIPWIDPLKEINAFNQAISTGLKSRQQISAELGIDWLETLKELSFEEKEIVNAGVTVQIGQPGANTTRDEETDKQSPKQGGENE